MSITHMKSNFLDEKTIQKWQDQCEVSIEEMKTLTNNAIISAFGEHLAISKMAVHALQGARGLVDTETLALMDSIDAAYNESAGAIAKLNASHKKMVAESSNLASALVGIQRKTQEISEHAEQVERLNLAMEQLKKNIDSGLFDMAIKCSMAIK